MAWKDNLRPGSFRGVAFFIDTSKKSLGRRAIQHEYPNRDEAYAEDLGRIAEGFEIDGHVIGDNYFEAKKQLEDAFNKKGPGELVHPFYGIKQVQVSVVEFSESNKEGAILAFTAKFLEAGSSIFPAQKVDKGAILQSKIDSSLISNKENFDNNFSISGLPGFAVQTARNGIAAATDTFNTATKAYADSADAIAELSYSTRSLAAETNDLLQAPEKLSQRLLDSYSLMSNAISNFNLKTDAFKSFFKFSGEAVIGSAPSPGGTPIRDQQAKNEKELSDFMINSAVILSAGSAVSSTYKTFQDASDKRDELIVVIEQQIRAIENSKLTQDLMDLKSILTDSLPDVDAELPSAIEIELNDVTNSLMLSYDIYESTKQEQDIINRNNISNPCFIQAGPIKVYDAR